MRTLQAVDRFLAAKGAAGRSSETLLFYRHRLTKFAEMHPVVPLETDAIDRFTTKWKGITRRNAYVAVHALYSWLVRTRQLAVADNPFLYMDPPKVRRNLPRVFSKPEQQRIAEAAGPPFERALVLTLFDAMTRIGELARCTKDDLVAEGLHVSGKSGPRMAPLLPQTVAYLRELPTYYLFPKKDKHGRYLDQPAHVNTLKNHFAAIVARAGITGRRRGPHTIRHTAATAWLRSSGDLYALRDALGHSSVKETEKYVALLNATELAEKHRQHSALRHLTAEQQMPLAL